MGENIWGRPKSPVPSTKIGRQSRDEAPVFRIGINGSQTIPHLGGGVAKFGSDPRLILLKQCLQESTSTRAGAGQFIGPSGEMVYALIVCEDRIQGGAGMNQPEPIERSFDLRGLDRTETRD